MLVILILQMTVLDACVSLDFSFDVCCGLYFLTFQLIQQQQPLQQILRQLVMQQLVHQQLLQRHICSNISSGCEKIGHQK